MSGWAGCSGAAGRMQARPSPIVSSAKQLEVETAIRSAGCPVFSPLVFSLTSVGAVVPVTALWRPPAMRPCACRL